MPWSPEKRAEYRRRNAVMLAEKQRAYARAHPEIELARRARKTPEQRHRAVERATAWKRNNPDKVREQRKREAASLKARGVKRVRDPNDRLRWAIKNRYGLTMEQFAGMMAAQDGKCAMCGHPPKAGKRLHVDHDHDTGAVRGLLCAQCNVGLGIYEKPGFLDQAATYLARHVARMKEAS